MTIRGTLRIFLFAALLLAPLGRIGIAQAMAGPAGIATGHCGTMPVGHPGKSQGDKGRSAIDCALACAAMAPAPAPLIDPPFAAATRPDASVLSSLAGIRPEADPPPPRFSPE